MPVTKKNIVAQTIITSPKAIPTMAIALPFFYNQLLLSKPLLIQYFGPFFESPSPSFFFKIPPIPSILAIS